jgi:ribonuclease BN (tRNA processing enzyme)
MRLEVLGGQGSSAGAHQLPGVLVNGALLLDAGSGTATLSRRQVLGLRQVLVSHAHLDHTRGLPALADYRMGDRAGGGRSQPLVASSIAPVIDGLRAYVFDSLLWPDFTTVPSQRKAVLWLHELQMGQPNRVGDLTVIPVPVHHTLPATGFVVHDDTATLVFSGDTGPTCQLWVVAREVGKVRAIIVETAFPNRLDDLAERSGHLTPARLARELDKMPPCPVWVYHIKPAFYEETANELVRLDGHVRVLSDGEIDVF